MCSPELAEERGHDWSAVPGTDLVCSKHVTGQESEESWLEALELPSMGWQL